MMRIISATSYSGSGANLTGLTGASAATYGSSSVTPVITVDGTGGYKLHFLGSSSNKLYEFDINF